ncbi:hypothetical protein C1T31_01205 [Hanstruepera neustonica]|uniref:DUF2061 domain-containing protein n=1 Tax=Hanstruepera neustonica TaxID=1445657 RepID=A0A2K1E3E1_9FLAO|nr:DUF2061 domain-containing protein [Hanstruepera neustonica]PNQ74787.1 hypothetical protein C1T31_01205 [Hanstruepera neustonica]
MAAASHKRHIAKTITWRLVGTLDTIVLSWILSGDPFIGLQIGVYEVITKMLLYYLHERLWFRVNLTKDGKVLESNKRHIAKTVTWRLVGTIDTMTLAWIVTGNPLTGLKIGLAEVITKMLLYYLHERVWYRINYGLSDRNK